MRMRRLLSIIERRVRPILAAELLLVVLLSYSIVTTASDNNGRMERLSAHAAAVYSGTVSGVEEAGEPLLEAAGTAVREKSFELYQLSVVSFADRWLGYPYRLGGRNIETGLDCAGFVNFVFSNAAGRSWSSMNVGGLFREVGGTSVSVDEMQPGDIIFFGSNLSHVAIYAGDGEIVHAMDESHGITRTTLFRGNGATYSGKPIRDIRRVLEDGEQLSDTAWLDEIGR